MYYLFLTEIRKKTVLLLEDTKEDGNEFTKIQSECIPLSYYVQLASSKIWKQEHNSSLKVNNPAICFGL